MGRGIITASRTARLRAEQEVASRGEKCARLNFSIGSQIAKNRFSRPRALAAAYQQLLVYGSIARSACGPAAARGMMGRRGVTGWLRRGS